MSGSGRKEISAQKSLALAALFELCRTERLGIPREIKVIMGPKGEAQIDFSSGPGRAHRWLLFWPEVGGNSGEIRLAGPSGSGEGYFKVNILVESEVDALQVARIIH